MQRKWPAKAGHFRFINLTRRRKDANTSTLSQIPFLVHEGNVESYASPRVSLVRDFGREISFLRDKVARQTNIPQTARTMVK